MPDPKPKRTGTIARFALLAVVVTGCENRLGKVEASVKADRCPSSVVPSSLPAPASPAVVVMAHCQDIPSLMQSVVVGMDVRYTQSAAGAVPEHSDVDRRLWKIECGAGSTTCDVITVNMGHPDSPRVVLSDLNVLHQRAKRDRKSGRRFVVDLAIGPGERSEIDVDLSTQKGIVRYVRRRPGREESGEATCEVAGDFQ